MPGGGAFCSSANTARLKSSVDVGATTCSLAISMRFPARASATRPSTKLPPLERAPERP